MDRFPKLVNQSYSGAANGLLNGLRMDDNPRSSAGGDAEPFGPNTYK